MTLEGTQADRTGEAHLIPLPHPHLPPDLWFVACWLQKPGRGSAVFLPFYEICLQHSKLYLFYMIIS